MCIKCQTHNQKKIFYHGTCTCLLGSLTASAPFETCIGESKHLDLHENKAMTMKPCPCL